jgi:Tfp pilus assembly protein FimT
MMLVTAVILVLSGIAIPRAFASLDHSRGLAAARFLAARMALARTQAVSRSATMALVFERDARGVAFRVYQDGNHNGVLAADILRRIDRPVDDPVRLFEQFPGVAIGVTPATPTDDPVRLGGSDILSFTPSGTSSSGTIYVSGSDGTQWAVRILGVTARARVLRYVPESGEWVSPL